MMPVAEKSIFSNLYESDDKKIKPKSKTSISTKDSIYISNSSKAFKKIDDFLNLGKPDRLAMDGMNEEEKKEFLKMLASLLKKGIVGYEVLKVNGKPEKHFIVNQIGNERIKGANLYKDKSPYKANL